MAGRKRFVFDAENFHFGQVPRKVGKTVLYVFLYMLLTFTLAVLTYLAFTLVFRTDTERRLRREIRMYERLYPQLEQREQLLGDAIVHLQHRDNEIYGVIFDTGAPGVNPMSDPLALSAVDTLRDSQLVGYTYQKADSLMQRSRAVDAAFERIFRTLSDSSTVLPPMTMPVRGITPPQVGAGPGRKIHPFYKAYVPHNGLDLLVSRGTPVYATADGTVASAANSRDSGNTVLIRHAGGYETLYAHLESMSVRAGQRVSAGQQIGTVGMSGQAFAPHLHYEVLKDGGQMDPVSYFFASVTPAEYANMLYMSVNTVQSMD
ncbi:MAG: M23 family metallopeptidase [Bacteroidales bacterium]|nr:M23 family metallopeptidase [Bacteroidales bacterium]